MRLNKDTNNFFFLGDHAFFLKTNVKIESSSEVKDSEDVRRRARSDRLYTEVHRLLSVHNHFLYI